MNFKLNLLKIVPLMITMAVGVLAPMEMANAASGNDHSPEADTTQEVVEKSSTPDSHAASTPGSHGETNLSEILTSPKAQKIEFFSFLSVIGLSLFVPEIFYRPKKEAQKLVIVEKNQAQKQNKTSNEEPFWQHESETVGQSIKDNVAPAQLVKLSQETGTIAESSKAENNKQDFPNLKIIDDSPTPYTIPNQKVGQFGIDEKIQLDNWSQPNKDRDAA